MESAECELEHREWRSLQSVGRDGKMGFKMNAQDHMEPWKSAINLFMISLL